MLQLVLELVKGFLHRPTPDQLPGLPRVETVVQRRAREVGPGESSDHIFFPSRQSFQHPFCRFGVRLHARSGRATRDEAEEISDRIVPDIRKGSDEAPHVAKRRQFPSPFTGCRSGPPSKSMNKSSPSQPRPGTLAQGKLEWMT